MMSRATLRSFATLRLSGQHTRSHPLPFLESSSFTSSSLSFTTLFTPALSQLQNATDRSSSFKTFSSQFTPSTSRTMSSLERMKLPPNLKIDPRSKLGPFIVKAPPIPPTNQQQSDLADDPFEKIDTRDNIQKVDTFYDDHDADVHDDDDDDDDEYDYWYEPPTPRFVIPLPDRLQVTVLDKTDFETPVGTIHLAPKVFGLDLIRLDLVHRVVQYQRNKKRGLRYPALTKTIHTVSGSGKKVRPQKGGGTSRAGHRRPPHWRGGAKAHGPKGKVQNYEIKMNKHTRKLGLVHALSQKLKEGNLMVMNDFLFDTHKTRQISNLLTGVGLSGNKGTSAYLVDWADDADELVARRLPLNLAVGAGNLPRIKVATQAHINVYDIVKHEKLVLTLSAIQQLEARFGNVAY